MTPKKDIVRKPTRTLPDGSPIPSMGKQFTPRENAFIYWYTNPGTEAQIMADIIAGRDFTASGDDDTHWKKAAEFLRGDDTRLIIAPPENTTDAL